MAISSAFSFNNLSSWVSSGLDGTEGFEDVNTERWGSLEEGSLLLEQTS
jgi:hypothetical protein